MTKAGSRDLLGAEDAGERACHLGGQARVLAARGGYLPSGVGVPGQAAVEALDLVQPLDQADAVTA